MWWPRCIRCLLLQRMYNNGKRCEHFYQIISLCICTWAVVGENLRYCSCLGVVVFVVVVQKLWHFVISLLTLKIFTWTPEYVFTIQRAIHTIKGDNSKCIFFFFFFKIMPLFWFSLFILYQANTPPHPPPPQPSVCTTCGALVPPPAECLQPHAMLLFMTATTLLVSLIQIWDNFVTNKSSLNPLPDYPRFLQPWQGPKISRKVICPAGRVPSRGYSSCFDFHSSIFQSIHQTERVSKQRFFFPPILVDY